MPNEKPLEDYQVDGAVQQTVPWMHGDTIEAYQSGLGAVKDDQQALDRAALMMRYTDGDRTQEVYRRVSERDPAVGIPSTAGDKERLRRLGASKGLRQYPTEDDVAFVRRIDATIDDLRSLATEGYVEDQLRAYGIPDVQIVEECYTPLGADGSTFALRFVVVLGPDFGKLGWKPLTMPFKLGQCVLGVAGMTRAQLVDVFRIVRAGKTAVSKPIAIVFCFGDFSVLGCGLKMPFKLGGSGGAAKGYARAPVCEGSALGRSVLGFGLGTNYIKE